MPKAERMEKTIAERMGGKPKKKPAPNPPKEA
jgi:hypothetical protein